MVVFAKGVVHYAHQKSSCKGDGDDVSQPEVELREVAKVNEADEHQ